MDADDVIAGGAIHGQITRAIESDRQQGAAFERFETRRHLILHV